MEPKRKHRASEDWVGHRHGKLTIIGFEGIIRFNGGGRATVFRFRCDCGADFVSQKSNVIPSRKDCGCGQPEKTATIPPGGSGHPLYSVWNGMIQRCENPKTKSFRDYGARGIAVCGRWKTGNGIMTGLECFASDMGPRPDGFTIERVQSDRGYEPGNCVWLSKPDQSKNRRTVRLVRIGTEVKTIPEWCRETGIEYWTAIRRVSRGWPPDKAVTHPIRKKVA